MIVQCDLCPKSCIVRPGQSGACRIRVNMDGVLRAVTYGFPTALHVDPVEKKPLNHFLPGTPILSIATVGCNLHCKNCQNWDISQRNPEDAEAFHLPPEDLPDLARRKRCPSVAYTYTEPLVYYEYTLDSCVQARDAGLRNVLVTAGYLNEKPFRDLCRFVDAANIDLKSMSERFYRDVCDATLAPILRNLVIAKSMGVLVEVTNLLITGMNDKDEDIQDLCGWIKGNLGPETPLHFSRFHPDFRMRHLPPTPPETLRRAVAMARDTGLFHVYAGNIVLEGSGNTYCPSCGELLIERRIYRILKHRMENGHCPSCREEIYGIWS